MALVVLSPWKGRQVSQQRGIFQLRADNRFNDLYKVRCDKLQTRPPSYTLNAVHDKHRWWPRCRMLGHFAGCNVGLVCNPASYTVANSDACHGQHQRCQSQQRLRGVP